MNFITTLALFNLQESDMPKKNDMSNTEWLLEETKRNIGTFTAAADYPWTEYGPCKQLIPKEMAEAGFSYLADGQCRDSVYCRFCKVELYGWKTDEIPLDQHQKSEKGKCKFLDNLRRSGRYQKEKSGDERGAESNLETEPSTTSTGESHIQSNDVADEVHQSGVLQKESGLTKEVIKELLKKAIELLKIQYNELASTALSDLSTIIVKVEPHFDQSDRLIISNNQSNTEPVTMDQSGVEERKEEAVLTDEVSNHIAVSLEKIFNVLHETKPSTELEFDEYVDLTERVGVLYNSHMLDTTLTHASELCSILNYISERANLGLQIGAEQLLIYTQQNTEIMRNGLTQLEQFYMTIKTNFSP